jgi:hypothetical protein
VYQPNEQLRHAREQIPSRQTPGECLSRQEVAELVNQWIHETTGHLVELGESYLGKLERGGAPRGAWLYPRRSREELEGGFLGPMAYLEPKGEGNRSMPGNQWPGLDVGDGVLGDPHDMAKAGLPESQSPEEESSPPPERRLKPVPALRRGSLLLAATFGAMERCPVRTFKEMSGTPKSCSHVRQDERGIAYGTRVLW